AEVTAVLAADLPNLRPHTLRRLRSTLAASAPTTAAPDGAVLVDERGRPQWLCGVWHTAGLRAALAGAGDPTDRPLRAVLGALAAVHVRAEAGEAFDVDTVDDLRALPTD
ncbi:MAG TPA: molybdenum cofactor guanylyltransferase, partial [Pseudonocardiaceae bacterium]